MIRSILLAAAAASTAISAQPLEAQRFSQRHQPRRHHDWLIDFGPQYARPLGDFRANVDRAWGLGGSLRYGIDAIAPLGVRADFAWFNYGNERKRVPLSPTVNRVLVETNTSNNIGLATIGPELAIKRGPIRPYAFAFAGFSYFYTQSSVGDDDDGNADFASTTNFDDGGWTTGWGGGVRIPLNTRKVDLAVDFGARVTHNGTRNYLTRGDVIDLPDGTLQFLERRSSADFVQYQVGVSFAPR